MTSSTHGSHILPNIRLVGKGVVMMNEAYVEKTILM